MRAQTNHHQWGFTLVGDAEYPVNIGFNYNKERNMTRNRMRHQPPIPPLRGVGNWWSWFGFGILNQNMKGVKL